LARGARVDSHDKVDIEEAKPYRGLTRIAADQTKESANYRKHRQECLCHKNHRIGKKRKGRRSRHCIPALQSVADLGEYFFNHRLYC